MIFGLINLSYQHYKHGGKLYLEQKNSQIASRILFEDSRIRIWEMILEPGQDSGRHHHSNDYVVVLVEGDKVGITEHIKTDGSIGTYREADITIGTAISLKKGGTETAFNPGSKRYRDIEIELLS